jgi:UDP-galactopyranose mutase
MKLLVVGAGLSGAVMARQAAEAGHQVTVLESRAHVAGNCHTERCPDTGVMVHVYGPHIFHTDDAGVWAYVQRFARFMPYRHQVRATVGGQVFSMPINLHTINQFFGTAMSPDEARAFVSARAENIKDPQSFEEQALSMVGRDLYEAFFKGYTEKQWGCAPSDLPASILTRLPLRFSYDDNYFAHRFQGIPAAGYTALVASMLDHSGIDVHLNTAYVPDHAGRADHVIWTGALDAYFGAHLGRLSYRTLDFERITARGDAQGCAVMNYPDAALPQTRITEHKHFAPWETHEEPVLYRECSRACGEFDIPYYPVRLLRDQVLLRAYEEQARMQEGVTFLGRLGTYRYLDMDVTIREALNAAERLLGQQRRGLRVTA